MTIVEFRAYCKNVYTLAAAAESAGNIPAGEGIQIARIAIEKILERDFIDVPRV